MCRPFSSNHSQSSTCVQKFWDNRAAWIQIPDTCVDKQKKWLINDNRKASIPNFTIILQTNWKHVKKYSRLMHVTSDDEHLFTYTIANASMRSHYMITDIKYFICTAMFWTVLYISWNITCEIRYLLNAHPPTHQLFAKYNSSLLIIDKLISMHWFFHSLVTFHTLQ